MRQVFQFMRRLFATAVAIAWTLAMDVALKLALLTKNPKILKQTIRFAVNGLCWIWKNCFLVKILIDPRLNSIVQNQKKVIVVSNHYSPFDMPLLMSTFPQEVKFIARPGLDRGIPFVSCYIRRCGCVSLHPDKRKNIEKLDRFAQALQDKGGIAVIFPEGRKFKSNYASLMRFKKGGLTSLIKAAPDAKVIPVIIDGTQQFWRGGLHLPNLGVTISISALREEDYQVARDENLAAYHCEQRIRLGLQRQVPSDKTLAPVAERRRV